MKHLKCYHTLLSILLLLGCLASCDVRQEEEEDSKLTPLVIKQINEGNIGSLTSLTLWKVKTPTFKVTYTYGRGQWVASPRPFYVEEITTKEQFVAMHTPADTEKDAVTGLTDIRVAGPSTVATNGILELDFHSLMAQVTIKLKNSDVDLKGAILSTPALYQTYTLNGIELTPSGGKTQYNATLSSSSLLVLPQDIAGEWSVTLPNGNRYSCTVLDTVLTAGKSCVLILEEAAPAVKVESITLDEKLSVQVGQAQPLTYTILPEDATNKGVTWNSDNPGVATVTDGIVTGMTVGETTITVTTVDGGKTAKCKVTVTTPTIKVKSIKFDETALKLEMGKTKSLTYTVLPENAADKTLTWSSSKPDVAAVDPTTGEIKGKGVGQATITATANDDSNVKGTCLVTVEAEKELITWAKGNLVAKEGGGCKIGAPGDYGLYFQFGSLIGWSGGSNGDGTGITPSDLALEAKVIPNGYEGTPLWNNSWRGDPATEDAHLGTGDPCKHYLGGAWRLPTIDEYGKLFGYASYDWAAATNWTWDRSSKSAINSVLDLEYPASGYRWHSGHLEEVGTNGSYWSASPNIDVDRGGSLSFGNYHVISTGRSNQDLGEPVRCVRDN